MDFLVLGCAVSLLIELADDAADLLRARERAEFLLGVEQEPAVERFAVEGEGVAGGWADGEGLPVLGEEDG